MKNFIIYSLLCFFVSSCTESTPDSISTLSVEVNYAQKTSSPINLSNPYDFLGQVYYSLYDVYYTSKHHPSTVQAVVDTLNVMAAQDSVFISLAPASFQFSAVSEVGSVLDCNSMCQGSLLPTYFSSASTRNGFSSFLDDYVLLCDGTSSYGAVHDFVVAYENVLLTDTLIPLSEKRLLLITTSIARHTAYAKKKKPKKNTDPEWTLLVTNLYGALDGGTRTDADAVIEALAVGIMSNK